MGAAGFVAKYKEIYAAGSSTEGAGTEGAIDGTGERATKNDKNEKNKWPRHLLR